MLIKKFIKIIIWCLIAIISYSICWLSYTRYQISNKPVGSMYIPRPSTIFHQQWQAQRKSLIQDIKAGKIDVDVVYSIMEAESISVEKMDSIMGDSLWRRFMEGSTNGKR